MYDKDSAAKWVAIWLKRPGLLGIPAALLGAMGASLYPYVGAPEATASVQRAEEENVAAAGAPTPDPLATVGVTPQCSPGVPPLPMPAPEEVPVTTPRSPTPSPTREVLPAAYRPDAEGDAAPIERPEPATQLEEPAETAGFSVQVASLPSRESAHRLAEQLVRRGLPARAAPYGFASGKWWHSVRLGPFSSRVEAERGRLALLPGEREGAVVLPRSRGAHFVQFASLRSRESAQKLASKLSGTGHLLRVDTVTLAHGEKWHCVRIGPFDDG
jgi:cell division septation protein DedD